MAQETSTFDTLAEVPEKAHRRRDWIAAAQVWLPVLGIVALGLFWAAEYFLRGEQRYLPAPLSHVHATWEADCAACHVDARPLGGNNWVVAVTGQTHVADAQCQSCHAGPPHHANERPGEVAGCTSCHQEHRGRSAALARVANGRCVSCHDNLAGHLKDGTKSRFDNVTDFPSNHPEFRRLLEKKKDPGTIAFNHKLHLTPGLRDALQTGAPFTLAHLPDEARGRYRRPGQDEAQPLQLDCASCHRTDATSNPLDAKQGGGLPRAAIEPARTDGAFMQPITFELHCQACHPLTFGRKREGDPKSELLAVRHRLQPQDIRVQLQGHFVRQYLKDGLGVLDHPLRPLPGKDPTRADEKKRVADLIDAKVIAAEKILFSPATCQRCHLEADLGQLVAPASIPQVWYEQARFDHTAHRAVDCRECHAGAFALEHDGTINTAASQRSADVLLPGIATCRNCHAPATGSAGQAKGGARFDCVECHRYHGGDHPLHGQGAAFRGVAAGLGRAP